MQTHQDTHAVPVLLAEMEKERQEHEITPRHDEVGETEVIHVYPVEGGGILFSTTEIPQDEPDVPIVDSQKPQTEKRLTTSKAPPSVLHCLLILLLFLCLDSAETFFLLFTPPVTVTVTPQVKTLSTTATVSIGGAGANIHGRGLPALTVSQSQTTQATGKGHQDATQAAGSLTFYNGSFSSKSIDAGTVFTGSDGIQVVTDQTALLPPGNPPTYGAATVPAHAVQAGSQGNIAAGDITTSVSSDVLVKNSQFAGGEDARDFPYVRKEDIDRGVKTVLPQLQQSEKGALESQLMIGESLVAPSCTQNVTASHAPGDEAQSVTVTVSKTCGALAYHPQELQRAGESILTKQNAASFIHFRRVGDMHMRILSQTGNGQRATLSIQLSSTWVYQLNKMSLLTLVRGKPRLDALRLLAVLPGVQSVSITGIANNETIPTDTAHIHLFGFFLVS